VRLYHLFSPVVDVLMLDPREHNSKGFRIRLTLAAAALTVGTSVLVSIPKYI